MGIKGKLFICSCHKWLSGQILQVLNYRKAFRHFGANTQKYLGNFCISSHGRCSARKGVLRKGVLKYLLKKGLSHRCFPMKFPKFLRTSFLQNTSRRLLLFLHETFPHCTKISYVHFKTSVSKTFSFYVHKMGSSLANQNVFRLFSNI